MSLRASDRYDFIVASDAGGNVFILLEQANITLKVMMKVNIGITVKSVDVDSKGNLALGLKTGDILYYDI